MRERRPPGNRRSPDRDSNIRDTEIRHLERHSPEVEAAPLEELRVIGPRAVEALFRFAPERVLRFFYTEAMARQAGPLCRGLAQAKKPYRLVSEEEMGCIAGTPLHQGMVAVARPKPELLLDARTLSVLQREGGLHFVLDGIGNPHNLGAIARSLAYFGYKTLVLTGHPDQAGLSSAAFRVAEGGLDALEVYRAPDFWTLMAESGEGFKRIGTALSGKSRPLEAFKGQKEPGFIILGNEERGLSAKALAQCSDVLMLPGSGVIQSLNVAQTAAILAYGLKPGAVKGTPPRAPSRGARPPRRRG